MKPVFFQHLHSMSRKQAKNPGLLAKAADVFTGGLRTTEELESLPGIEKAPEGNILSGAGLLLASNPKEQQQIIKTNMPDATFREDAKGNTIVSLPSGEYALQKPGLEERDLDRFITREVLYGPASKLNSIRKAIAGAGLTEAALQGIEKATGGFFDDAEVYMAGGMAAAGKALENIVSAVDRFRRADIPIGDAETIKAGKEFDVPIMTTDVVEPETLAGKLARSTGETVPFAGTGGQRAAQQQARERVTSEFTEGLTPQYDEVVSSLQEKTGTIRKAAGNRLQRVGDQMEEFGEIPTSNSIQAIDDHIADLTAPGRVADTETVTVLEKYKTALGEGQTFKLLDTLRTDFRESVKGERVSLPTRSNAAMEKIYKSMTDDIESAISSSIDPKTAERFKQAKGVYAREMETIKKTRLKSVLDKGDVTPENVKNLLLSQKPSEMKQLYVRLGPSGRSAARATILSNALEKASSRVGGLTPNSFATQLGKHKSQIDIFFKGEEKAQIKGLEALLNATRRAQDASVATPTGQQLIGVLGGASVLSNPVATIFGGGSVGVMARVYESRPVRDALLKIESLKGDARDRAIVEAATAIQSSLQAARPEASNLN